MGWEFRNGKPYYYRKVRDGRKVRSEYVGPFNEHTRLCVALDQLDREQRQGAAAERQQFTELVADPPELAELLGQARAAVQQALERAGYHQHKRGEWRKRRAKKAT